MVLWPNTSGINPNESHYHVLKNSITLLLFCYKGLPKILDLWTSKPIQVAQWWTWIFKVVIRMHHDFDSVNNLQNN